MAILEIKNLTHYYTKGLNEKVAAIRDINFSVEEGEFIGVIGHTGSGKSTLIMHLNGLLAPDEGEVLLNGVNIFADKEFLKKVRFEVGLVFQYPEYQLFEETVYKDIAFGPKNMKLSEDEIDSRVKEALKFVGLPESILEESPFDLSGGQKRRVAVAGVIAMRPKILVLDEVAAGLDPQGRDDILMQLSRYHKETGATILMISHSMTDVAKYTDKVLVLANGEVEMFCPPDEVFSHSDRLLEIGLEVPQITRIFRRLKAAGLPVSENIYDVEKGKQELITLWESRRK